MNPARFVPALLLAGFLQAAPVTWERSFRYQGGTHENPELLAVNIRVTCKKASDGKPGAPASVEITIFDYFQMPTRQTLTLPYCPNPDDLSGRFEYYFNTPPIAGRAAGLNPVAPTPADHRIFVANTSGVNGRREIFSMDVRTFQATSPIDTGDRLPGGLALSPDGTRLYAALSAYTLGPGPVEPAYVAYIDPATNAIVDRVTIPGIALVGKPALSPDGHWLYFTGRADGGQGRIHVLDVQAKALAGVLPAAPFNANLIASAVSPDGAMVCATESVALYCYDTRTRTYLGSLPSPNASTDQRPLFHPDGSLIYLLVRESGAPAVWGMDTATLTHTVRIPLPLPSVADFRPNLARLSISPDGSRLIVDEGFTGVQQIIDTRTHRILRTIVGLTTGGLGTGFVRP